MANYAESLDDDQFAWSIDSLDGAELTAKDLNAIGRLQRADFAAIVEKAALPDEVGALLVEKLISRRNSMMKLTGLDSSYPDIAVNRKITLGKVVQGRLTQCNFQGYAAHFSYGFEPCLPASRYNNPYDPSSGMRPGH